MSVLGAAMGLTGPLRADGSCTPSSPSLAASNAAGDNEFKRSRNALDAIDSDDKDAEVVSLGRLAVGSVLCVSPSRSGFGPCV
jgi:hypothetical protein